jgi:hypothetical protein
VIIQIHIGDFTTSGLPGRGMRSGNWAERMAVVNVHEGGSGIAKAFEGAGLRPMMLQPMRHRANTLAGQLDVKAPLKYGPTPRSSWRENENAWHQ